MRKKTLLNYEKKNINVEDLASLLKFSLTDVKKAHEMIESLTEGGLIEPVKASGKNGNLTYSWYKKYRITAAEEIDDSVIRNIKRLNSRLLQNGYLPAHPLVYLENMEVIDGISRFLFANHDAPFISRKERSFELFGKEKVLDSPGVKSLLKSLQITENELRFYDTPEYYTLFSVVLTLMNYTRATEGVVSKNSKSVLILDNPFGKITSAHLLKPMFDIAKHFNVQLICLSDINKSDVINCFDCVIKLVIKTQNLSNFEIMTHEGNEKIEHGYYKIMNGQLSLF